MDDEIGHSKVRYASDTSATSRRKNGSWVEEGLL
jgi:hypothetical protein